MGKWSCGIMEIERGEILLYWENEKRNTTIRIMNESGLKRCQKLKNVAKSMNIMDINYTLRELVDGAIENQAVTGV